MNAQTGTSFTPRGFNYIRWFDNFHGTFRLRSRVSTVAAARDDIIGLLHATQREGFAGYLYWTYDTFEQPELWHAKSGHGEIFDALTAATPVDRCP